jgi:hypothetical protein
MRLPRRNIGPWAKELIDECTSSREARIDLNRLWTSYYYCGTSDGEAAFYNRTFCHIDRLASFLFSPTEVRFMLEGDPASDPADLDLLASGARYLNAEFNRTNSDLVFSSAVNWGLIKGCALVKQLWGHDGLEPWLVQPEQFGVLREDIADLDRQEAFVETTYLTKSAFARTLIDHPEKKSILAAVEQTMVAQKDGAPGTDDYLMQIVVGGTAPVSTTASTGKAMVNFSSAPKPMLAPETLRRLVRLDELWVQDSERNDYTTIRMVQDIVIEGADRHRNLGGVSQEHPYTKVCPNDVDGYFWGLSEIASVYKLQDLLNSQIDKLQRVTALKSDPPRALIGFTGMNQEKYNALRRPGGFISEDAPNAKIETLSPDVPQELLIERINATIQYFDDVSGFTPVMLGMGDQGVRSQAQAQTLARNSSPRMRDRALLVERQSVEFGEYSMKLMQAKEAEIMTTEEKQEFILAQLPTNYRTTIDSHTSSPAFQEDTRNLAIGLRKLGVIDDESTIMMVHPPHEDTLVLKARAKAKAQAQLVAQHPELLTKPGGGKKK